MQNMASRVVILGTGGTIAGSARRPGDNVGYEAARIGIADLLAAVPMLGREGGAETLEAEQLAQIDSKDMDFDVWRRMALRLESHLARDDVQAVVLTHGTDTLEETAYFLHRVVQPAKPVVLTAAMRPTTALQADGPQNLLDAVTVARTAGATGVLVVMAGAVHGALDVRKVHPYRLDAFSSGDAGVLAQVEEAALRCHRAWPAAGNDADRFRAADLPANPDRWPRVDIVTSHAGADGRIVTALRQAGVDGIVAACTGNGTLHRRLEAALLDAQAAGVRVVRSSRCLDGTVLGGEASGLVSAGALTPVKARVALVLDLLRARGA